jgi:hypothetical protein
MRKHYKSDSIEIKLTGGDAYAGNGGNGYNKGDITNVATLNINPYNKADGSVDYNTGDKVHQTGPTGEYGDQEAKHYGSNTGGAVTTTVAASQTNEIWADQTQKVYAGVGGDGGHGASATGGSVDIDIGHFPEA